MIARKIVKAIEEEAKEFFKDVKGCHDWTHVERVRNMAIRIGKAEKADLSVIEVAAILHDIGRKEEAEQKGKICHAEHGAQLADKILRKHKIDDKKIKNILHCILTHRFRRGHQPETIEAKCVFDADKLDSIGAVGVARDFLFAGDCGSLCLYMGNEKKLAKSGKDHSYTNEDSALLEYEIKLKHVKNKMLTKIGKKMANDRDKFMKKFFERFWLEVKAVK